ncbi:hypothetical protein Tco_0744072, partial [Tanacetum coccineum]
VVVNMGASYGSLRATDFTAAAKKDDATVKWYHDSNAEISVGVPMAPPLPTDDAYLIHFLHIQLQLDYPLLETGEAILLSKLTLSVCGSKQVEALQWEPHDKVIADDRHIVIEAPLYQTMSFKIPKLRMVEAKGKWVRGRRVYQLNVYFHGPKKIGGVHGTASPCLYLQPPRLPEVVVNMGAAYGSLRATDFAAAAKKDDADDDDTIKWYRDTNAQISVGVPMAPPLPNDDATNGIPTSRVTWEVEPCERHRHMIIELDYPLLETGEAILLSKLTLGVCGSKQVEALQWEPHDKVIADDRHIVIEAPLYRTMSFKIPKLRVVEAKGEWVRGRRVYKLSVYFHDKLSVYFSLPLSVAAFLRNFENFRNGSDVAE